MKTQRNTKPKSVFERSFPIVATALGRLCGVVVEIGGQVSSTDGKTIRSQRLVSFVTKSNMSG